jgi:tetratricopeptide (TPR) repeat protein
MVNFSSNTSTGNASLSNAIRHKKRAVAAFYNKHKTLTILTFLVIISLSIYANPQAFINLWLTRDQQAIVALKQGDTAKAAITFADKNWIAYSFYADGNFEQAAVLYKALYKKMKGTDAQFSLANAMAHMGQYTEAGKGYQSILKDKPHHVEAQANLTLINELIEKMKNAPRKKSKSEEVAGKPKISDDKSKPKERKAHVSSELWIKQIQQNPSKFLRKKFQQEYTNANKS